MTGMTAYKKATYLAFIRKNNVKENRKIKNIIICPDNLSKTIPCTDLLRSIMLELDSRAQ